MSNKITEIIAWLGLADNDYIASRALLMDGHLLPGAVLANSAVEKYFKTVHRIKNLRFNQRGNKAHNLLNLYKSLKNNITKFDLNENYLNFLTRAHKLRYPDKLEKGYSIALSLAKTIVGLDEIVFKIRSRIQLRGGDRRYKFDVLIDDGHQPLLQWNHVFGQTKRVDLFKNPLSCYEMRVLINGEWMEANYIAQVIDDENYDLDGIRPGSSDKEFHLQWTPINQEK